MRSYELGPIDIVAESRCTRAFVLAEKVESVGGICRRLSKISAPNMHCAFGEPSFVISDRTY
jgi:hypothetical protein